MRTDGKIVYQSMTSTEKITYSIHIHSLIQKLHNNEDLSHDQLDKLEDFYQNCLECMLIKPEDFGRVLIEGYKQKIARLQAMKATIRAA